MISDELLDPAISPSTYSIIQEMYGSNKRSLTERNDLVSVSTTHVNDQNETMVIESNDNDDEMTPHDWDGWHRESWQMHNDRYSSHSIPTYDKRTRWYHMQAQQSVPPGTGKTSGVGMKSKEKVKSGKMLLISEFPGMKVPPHLVNEYIASGHFFEGSWAFPYGVNCMRVNCRNMQRNLKPEKVNVSLRTLKGETILKNYKKYELDLSLLTDIDPCKYYATIRATGNIDIDDFLTVESYKKGNTVGPFGTPDYMMIQGEAIKMYNELEKTIGSFDKICPQCITVIVNNSKGNKGKHNRRGCPPVFQQKWASFMEGKKNVRREKAALKKSKK